MLPKRRAEIIEVGKESARIGQAVGRLKSLQRMDLFNDQAAFWVWRSMAVLGVTDPNQEEIDEATALSVRLMAADTLAGNMSRVAESLVGQSLWLSATAVRLASRAEAVPDSPTAADERSKLYKLALQAQRQAAQTLCSAAALGKEGVTVEGD